MNHVEKFLEQHRKVVESNEIDFLRYLIDCCENVLENERVLAETNIYSPVALQLIKLRAEVTNRLRDRGVTYGKFAEGTHLLGRR